MDLLKEKEWYQPGKTIDKFANVSVTTTMEDAYELFKADSLIHRSGWQIRKDAAGATSWSRKRNSITNNRCEEESCEGTRPDKDELFEVLQDIEHENPDVSTDDIEVQETVRSTKRKKHPHEGTTDR